MKPIARLNLDSSYQALMLLSAVLCVATPCSSAKAEERSPTGLYFGLGMGIAVDLFDDLPSGVDLDSGLGFSLDFGYRFHPNIAIEGNSSYFKGMHTDDTAPPTEGDILSFAGNVKVYLSTQRIQPYFLVGLGVTRVRFEDGPDRFKNTGVTVHAGGGLDYYLVPGVSLGIKVAYVEATGKIGDNDHVSIGLGAQYRF